MISHANHECELNINIERLFTLPCRTRWEYFFYNILRPFFMISIKNPRALYYLKNQSAVIYEKRQHLRHHTRIIHPFSIFRHWWNILIFINLIISLLCIPYQAAFDIPRNFKYWSIIKNILLVNCCIDIVINFMTGYFNKTDRKIEMNWKIIINNYIFHGTFIPDVIGSLPTDILFIHNWNDLTVIRELISMIHICRLPSMHGYIVKIAEIANVPRAYFGVLTLMSILLIILHWSSCIFWIIPIAVASSSSSSPSSLMIRSNDCLLIGGQKICLDPAKKDLYYWHSLIQTIAIITRSGVFEPIRTNESQLMAILIQMTCMLTSCYIVSQAMWLFKAKNSSKLKYQEIVAQLKQFMQQKQLPKTVQQRLLTYYEFHYQHMFYHDPEIIATLSPYIRQEIGMHSCRKLVENVAIFKNLPVALLTRLVSQLKSEIFLTNDVIVRAKEPGDCMYFIATGTVAVYAGESGREICHLNDGAYFGEISLVMPGMNRIATVIAVELCELYKLKHTDFMRTIYPYPILWERIKNIAIDRHEKTRIIEDIH